MGEKGEGIVVPIRPEVKIEPQAAPADIQVQPSLRIVDSDKTPPQQVAQPKKRNLLAAMAVLASGVGLSIGAGKFTNAIAEPTPNTPNTSKEPEQKPFKGNSQYPPTPTAADKAASDEYRQRQQQILANPDDPQNKIEGMEHPQNIATPYPGTNPHKVK